MVRTFRLKFRPLPISGRQVRLQVGRLHTTVRAVRIWRRKAHTSRRRLQSEIRSLRTSGRKLRLTGRRFYTAVRAVRIWRRQARLEVRRLRAKIGAASAIIQDLAGG